MPDMNVAIVIGNLTAEPELRHTTSGTPVASLRIGVTGRVKNGEEWENESNYFAVTVWGREAENADRFLTKGSRIAVHGRLRYRTWEAEDGAKRSAVEIVAHDLQYLSSVEPREDSATEVEDGIPF